MKAIRIDGTRGLILILTAVFGVGVGFTSPVLADAVIVNPDGKVTVLGTLGGHLNSTLAQDINDAGQVVGWSDTADGAVHAFITGPNGQGMTDLGTLGGADSFAYGINDAGQIVGASSTAGGDGRAFITGPNGQGMTDLGFHGVARGINDAGQVTGVAYSTSNDQAFITGPNGQGMTVLGFPSRAYGINDAGQVVGDTLTADGGERAFITGPNGVGMTVLGTLGGGTYTTARGINDAGQVVGESVLAGGGSSHAYITGPNGQGITDLDPLGEVGGSYSAALDINDAGQVVGAGSFITGPNGQGMINIHSYADLPDGIFLSLTDGGGINNLGQVIAQTYTAVVPEPASYALMLAGLGLVGFMARSKKQVA